MHHRQDLQKERIRHATLKKRRKNESSHAAMLLFMTISNRAIGSMEQHTQRRAAAVFSKLNATFCFCCLQKS
jgi:hypothetical protein